MIKKLALSTLVVAFSAPVFAATETAAKSSKSEAATQMVAPKAELAGSASSVHIVPVIGMASMTMKSSEVGMSADNGLSVGALGEFGKDNVTFQTGLLYNQFGSKVTDSELSTYGISNLKLNLNYLNIPAIAKFNLSGAQDSTFFLKAGLMPGILVSKEAKATIGGTSVSTSKVSGLKTFDLPAVVGLGGMIAMGNGYSILLDASYVRSLTTVVNDGNVYNEGFILSSGINIPL